MSIRERTSSTSFTTRDHKVRVVVRTEIERIPGHSHSQPTNGINSDFAKLVIGVIAVDEKKLRNRLEAALRDMNNVADAWSRLEEKLEETHGEDFDLRLAGYPGKLDRAVDSLKDALDEVEKVASVNGRWIASCLSRVNEVSMPAETELPDGIEDEESLSSE